MPTPPPKPVDNTVSEEEKKERETAVILTKRFLAALTGYAYSTRSHMPAGLDYTDFVYSVNKVISFIEERPDWTLEILREYTLGAKNE